MHQHLGAGNATSDARQRAGASRSFRGRGLAQAMITVEIVGIARDIGLEKWVEAEFIGEQEAAIKMFAMLGFSNLVRSWKIA